MSTADTTSSDKPKETLRSTDTERPGKAPATRGRGWLKTVVLLACLAGAAAGGGWYWWQMQQNALPIGIEKSNGRLESEQVEIATKYPGRIAAVLAREGQTVQAGEVVARMDTTELEAQRQAAEAQVQRSQFEKLEADALIVQRDSERTLAAQELQRATNLNQRQAMSTESLQQRQNQMKTAEAAYDTAVASLSAVKATIAAGQAEVSRLRAQINDSTLVAPKGGRVQYKLAQPGEVLAAGGRVLTVIDLSEVYMTIFLPAHAAGPLTVGDEARVTLDPLLGYVFPATVTFVATEVQFTPKTVETPEEREKLMFRVKLTIDPTLRTKYENQVKTGIRGVGFVRSKADLAWPESLSVKLP